MRVIHTADWQLGKPFARVSDPYKRSLLQQARIEAVSSLGALATETGAELVLVAGDLFDSPSADRATVSAACGAIGQIPVPVVAIPGNHDNGGPGSVWEQEFFRREREALAPNLTVLLEPAPYHVGSAVILPCPLLRRSTVTDPTEWLRSSAAYADLPADIPRIVLAHGSTQTFVSQWDEDGEGESEAGIVDVGRLPDAEVDYVALGDWHGTKQVGPKAWQAGTPEPDRFTKGGDHDPGNVLVVDVVRGGIPTVTRVHTGMLGWIELQLDLADDSALGQLEERLASLLGQRTNQDLLKLSLTGTMGIEAYDHLDRIVESLQARLLRVKLDFGIQLAPTPEEISGLTARATDPLISRVAARLVEEAATTDDAAAVARAALRQLHAALTEERAS